MNFEEVALKFLDVNERDSLRSYLISRLERTKRSVPGFLVSLAFVLTVRLRIERSG